MASKRSPQTAAKRAREQAMREKRERKALKKQAAIAAKNAPEPTEEELLAAALEEGAEGVEGAEAQPENAEEVAG